MINRHFYFLMSLLIAAVVVLGFGPNLDSRLFHPAAPRPVVLHVHAAVFTAWILFFVLQTALVRVKHVRAHRTLGMWVAILGVAVPVLGVATAIVIDRQDVHPDDGAAAFLFLSFHDMIAFAITFALAFHWRRRPEYHRRLMLISTCILTAAAFGRIIPDAWPEAFIYVGVDALILLGMSRDWLTARHLHPVYRWGFAAILSGQLCALYVYLQRPPEWLLVAHRIIG